MHFRRLVCCLPELRSGSGTGRCHYDGGRARAGPEPEPTAPVRPRRYELPLRMHQLIDTSIRDTFQDELFTHPGAEKDGEERNDTVHLPGIDVWKL